MLFVCIFYFFPWGTLGIFGWVHVCAAGALEPLASTRASLSEFFPPYTGLNSPIRPIKVAAFQKLMRSLAHSSQNKTDSFENLPDYFIII